MQRHIPQRDATLAEPPRLLVDTPHLWGRRSVMWLQSSLTEVWGGLSNVLNSLLAEEFRQEASPSLSRYSEGRDESFMGGSRCFPAETRSPQWGPAPFLPYFPSA